MVNANAAAGKAYERAVVDYVNATYPVLAAFKIAQPSFRDRGDIRLSTVVLQAKAMLTGAITVARYLSDAAAQTTRHHNGHLLVPAVIIRRDGPSVADDMVVLRAADFFELLHQRDRAMFDRP